MNTVITGLCSVLFAILAPVITVAGILVTLGATGPIALVVAVAATITGGTIVKGRK